MSRTTAQERLGRLLAIVPWIAARDGPRVAEVCERFGVVERDLLEDLDLLFLCGVHPFTPDTLIEVDVADGRVWIRFADYFRRPLRLTPPEGLGLVSAGAALLAVPGADPDGALARALAKLETVLGVGADDAVDVELARAPAEVLGEVRTASQGHRKVEIDYYSFGRDGYSTRVIHPWRVFNALGQWYVQGWCEQAAGERLFRIDRITGVRGSGVPFVRPDTHPASDTSPAQIFAPDPTDPVVVLDLEPDARWVAEQYPNEGVEPRPGGIVRITLRSGQPAWLARLLLRAGPDARVVAGDGSAGPDAATRILARYRRGGAVR